MKVPILQISPILGSNMKFSQKFANLQTLYHYLQPTTQRSCRENLSDNVRESVRLPVLKLVVKTKCQSFANASFY